MVASVRYVLRLLKVSLRDLAPVVVVMAAFQLLVVRAPLPGHVDGVSIAVGLVAVLIGLTLFVQGLELGLFPMGEDLAGTFARKGSVPWLLLFAFGLGFGTAVAEPALIAVTEKAAETMAEGGRISGESARASFALTMRLVVAGAVGAAVVVGVLRILFGWPLPWIIAGGYVGVLGLTAVAPPEIIGIAYDSGGVTTSTITVPLLTALGVGLSLAVKGRNPMLDGFGLIAFAALTPILSVLAFGAIALPSAPSLPGGP